VQALDCGGENDVAIARTVRTRTCATFCCIRPRAGEIALEVSVHGDAAWLTQPQMVMLFGRERSVVTKQVKDVFAEGELGLKSNVQNMHIAFSDKPVGRPAYHNNLIRPSFGRT
jgi:hypothetical protein